MHHDTAEAIDSSSEKKSGWSCGNRTNKRRWSAPEIGVVVGSFILFWPLGIAALGIKLVKGELWRGASDAVPPWQSWKDGQNWKQGDRFDFTSKWKPSYRDGSATGNAAFDDYRKAAYEKLEAERRKLDEERREFAEHVAKVRRAKDQDEFDRFMRERTPKVE